MRVVLLLAAVSSLAACGGESAGSEPDVTGAIEAGGGPAGGSTLDTPGVDSTGAGLDPDAPDASPATFDN